MKKGRTIAGGRRDRRKDLLLSHLLQGKNRDLATRNKGKKKKKRGKREWVFWPARWKEKRRKGGEILIYSYRKGVGRHSGSLLDWGEGKKKKKGRGT